MAVTSIGELFSALQSRDFDRVLGTPESSWVDFKAAPYLQTDKAKWELTKDVAAFANASGGVIVLGFRTERHETSRADTAYEVRPVALTLVDAQQMNGLIEARVFPRVRGVRAHWFEHPEGAGAGVCAIEIPPQPERDKYFVLERLIDVDGKHVTGLGVPVREGADIEWLRAEQVQRLIGDGLWAARDMVRAQSVKAAEDLAERSSERLQALIQRKGWSESPTYFIQALPPAGGPARLAHLHEAHGIREKFKRPYRPYGFDFSGTYELEPFEGGLAVLGDPRQAVVLAPDGLLTVASLATDEWLARERKHTEGSPYRLNTTVLVESTFAVFRFVDEALRPAVGHTSTGAWRFRVGVRNLSKPPSVTLSAGLPDWWDLAGTRAPVTVDTKDFCFDDIGDAARNSAHALYWVYSLFGHPESAVPFVVEDRFDYPAMVEHLRNLR